MMTLDDLKKRSEADDDDDQTFFAGGEKSYPTRSSPLL